MAPIALSTSIPSLKSCQLNVKDRHESPANYIDTFRQTGVEWGCPMIPQGFGERVYDLAARLFSICRSLTGDGVRETFARLNEVCPDLMVHEIPSADKVFDWTIPKEWNIRDGYIMNSQGEKVLDFKKNNLHIVGYSAPVDKWVKLNELLPFIFSLPNQPELIPYVTSYYREQFGFCMSANQKNALPEDNYHIYIDSELRDGSLTYGDILIKGESEKEILFSTYICHPSLANDNLSGPCLAIHLAKWMSTLQKRKFSYRFVFIPETIGSIAYINENLATLKRNVVAGFVITCVGDNNAYSYLSSRSGSTLADRVAKNVLKFHTSNYISYSYLERGSDEAQYCSAGVDLPVCSIMRTKYGKYEEYHTSGDDLNLISKEGLDGAFMVYAKVITVLEHNEKYKMTCTCDPQLGKRGLYPTTSIKGSVSSILPMMNFIAYANGNNDLIDISNIIGVNAMDLLPIISKLETAELLEH
ncbi:MAG: DUF4910 domain-containing protein [Deltaproteobacteria bacterium]